METLPTPPRVSGPDIVAIHDSELAARISGAGHKLEYVLNIIREDITAARDAFDDSTVETRLKLQEANTHESSMTEAAETARRIAEEAILARDAAEQTAIIARAEARTVREECGLLEEEATGLLAREESNYEERHSRIVNTRRSIDHLAVQLASVHTQKIAVSESLDTSLREKQELDEQHAQAEVVAAECEAAVAAQIELIKVKMAEKEAAHIDNFTVLLPALRQLNPDYSDAHLGELVTINYSALNTQLIGFRNQETKLKGILGEKLITLRSLSGAVKAQETVISEIQAELLRLETQRAEIRNLIEEKVSKVENLKVVGVEVDDQIETHDKRVDIIEPLVDNPKAECVKVGRIGLTSVGGALRRSIAADTIAAHNGMGTGV